MIRLAGGRSALSPLDLQPSKLELIGPEGRVPIAEVGEDGDRQAGWGDLEDNRLAWMETPSTLTGHGEPRLEVADVMLPSASGDYLAYARTGTSTGRFLSDESRSISGTCPPARTPWSRHSTYVAGSGWRTWPRRTTPSRGHWPPKCDRRATARSPKEARC